LGKKIKKERTDMNCFITGASGFLGTTLIQRLREINYECTAPTSYECNLLNYQNLMKFSNIKYDQIIHLAAWTQAGDFCIHHSGEQFIINQKINTNIIEWWQKEQPQSKLIFIGTSCAYSPNNELVETEYMNGEPIESLYTYAMTKRMMLQGARAINKQYGLNWLCLVPSTLYGPNYHVDGRQMHFIFDIARKILEGKYYNRKVILWGNGYQKRELVYVDDFVRALIYLSKSTNNEIINIGAGEDFTIREFANNISNIICYDFNEIEYDVHKYVGATSKKLSIDKLLSIYPDYYHNSISLNEGLENLVEWLKLKYIN
jgi:GDP-L-fucose synthase